MNAKEQVEYALQVLIASELQEVELAVLSEGTEVMVRSGASPWDVALVTLYFDKHMNGK